MSKILDSVKDDSLCLGTVELDVVGLTLGAVGKRDLVPVTIGSSANRKKVSYIQRRHLLISTGARKSQTINVLPCPSYPRE
jgi:hypothetical protein